MINPMHLGAGRMPVRMSRQRGVVLFIALIVMVAMSLAAIALMRSVDTTTAVIGSWATVVPLAAVAAVLALNRKWATVASPSQG